MLSTMMAVFSILILVGAVSTWKNKVAADFAYGLALLFAIAFGAHATSARAAEPAEPATAEHAGTGKSDLELGPVHSAHALIGAVVKTRGGEEFGRINDLSLDIGRGTVAAIHVMPTTPIDGKPESLSMPITRLQWPHAGGDIVVDTQPGAPPARPAPSDPEDTSRVVSFSTLGDIPIHNARGDKLGFINDFGIAPQKGRITYVIMILEAEASTADTLYPIPLAAFVVRANTRQWIMELPEGILENTPTIKKSQWPTTVPRAWSEYVSVRYGHSPTGGVQLELHEKK
jgi:sporulation protein YlmC with PRC-barrel domain